MFGWKNLKIGRDMLDFFDDDNTYFWIFDNDMKKCNNTDIKYLGSSILLRALYVQGEKLNKSGFFLIKKPNLSGLKK